MALLLNIEIQHSSNQIINLVKQIEYISSHFFKRILENIDYVVNTLSICFIH